MVRFITNAINNFGDMPVDPEGNFTLNTMSDWLAANPTFSLRDNNQTVPIGIARFGIYLHLLGDRLSHYYCSDAPGSTMTLVSDNPPVYALKFSPLACNIPVHILQHFWEVGHPYNVPQTSAAVSIMWSEISAWTVEMRVRNPSWFRASRTDLTGEVLTAINQMMHITDAQARMQFFLDKLQEFKFDTFPGFDDYSTVCPTA